MKEGNEMYASQPPRRSSGLRTVLLLILILFIAGGSALVGAVAGGWVVKTSLDRELAARETALFPTNTPLALALPTQTLSVSSTTVESAVIGTVERIGPAVVTVLASIPGQTSVFGTATEGQSSGSGVIISADGHILTNHHVIEGAREVRVVLADGSELPASIVNYDVFADLAVLKADGAMPAVAPLGNSDQLKPGETVIAIGSPLGTFKNTVTVGVVSGTGRMIDTGNGYVMEGLIQTDAAINQGNSGGPLVNLAGEVIGINTLIVRGGGMGSAVAEGLGFAIPSNTAAIISDQIIQNGYFARPYLGVRSQDISPSIARRYSLPVEWGTYVFAVLNDSPAARSGIQKDDIIVAIGEIEIDDKTTFANALFSYGPNDTVTIKLLRGSETVNLNVTLGETKNN
jgi:2-alkenal reductase